MINNLDKVNYSFTKDEARKLLEFMVDLYKDIFVTLVYDQEEKIIYQLDTCGENYYLQKGDTTWHPFDGRIASHSLVIPRSEAEIGLEIVNSRRNGVPMYYAQ